MRRTSDSKKGWQEYHRSGAPSASADDLKQYHTDAWRTPVQAFKAHYRLQGIKAYQRLIAWETNAKAALANGDTQTAARLATEQLALHPDESSGRYGEIVYEANQILGLAALREGDLIAAKAYLLAAGKTPGAPSLNSFGPKMPLAQELLEREEFEAVAAFLDQVARFWATPPVGRVQMSERQVALYARHAELIAQWQQGIQANEKPTLNCIFALTQNRPSA